MWGMRRMVGRMDLGKYFLEIRTIWRGFTNKDKSIVEMGFLYKLMEITIEEDLWLHSNQVKDFIAKIMIS